MKCDFLHDSSRFLSKEIMGCIDVTSKSYHTFRYEGLEMSEGRVKSRVDARLRGTDKRAQLVPREHPTLVTHSSRDLVTQVAGTKLICPKTISMGHGFFSFLLFNSCLWSRPHTFKFIE